MNRFLFAVIVFVSIASLPLGPSISQAENPFGDAKTVLFLGDSNTYSGHYIALVESRLRASGHEKLPTFINSGLSSETCTGLSEPIHPFPRPDVHERLDRALEKIQPDVVYFTYGTNDGIYAPLSDERFQAYQHGVEKLIRKIEAADAEVVICTPPAFDPLPMEKKGKLVMPPQDPESYSWKTIFGDYDKVLATYATWLRETYGAKYTVLDFHTAMSQFLASKRIDNPEFTTSGDGIHFNQEGHAVLAETILKDLGVSSASEVSGELLKAVSKKQRLLRDAWHSEVGHKRPGIKPGLPIEEAQQLAAEIDAAIDAEIDGDADTDDETESEADAKAGGSRT